MKLFHPDVAWCFDYMLESATGSADVVSFFYYFHPDPNVWHDSVPEDFKFEQHALAEYLKWRLDAKPIDRLACSMIGALWLKMQAETSGRDAYMRIFRRFPRIDDSTKRYLKNKKSMRRCVLKDLDVIDFVDRSQDHLDRMSKDFDVYKDEESKVVRHIMNLKKQRNNLQMQQLQAKKEAVARMNVAAARQILSDDELDDTSITVPRTMNANRYIKKLRRAQRKALVRSSNTMTQIVGESKTRAFLSGDQIAIEGGEFDFRVRRGRNLNVNGHCGMEITVVDKSGIVLTDLCFYFENTPPVDQIVGMALHAMAGDETEIVKAGNAYRVTNAGLNHPRLIELKGKDKLESRRVFETQEARDEARCLREYDPHMALRKALTKRLQPHFPWWIGTAICRRLPQIWERWPN